MALKSIHLFPLIQILFLVAFSTTIHAKDPSVFDFITKLQGCHKGNKTENIHLLKHYLKEFGYLNQTLPESDYFDGSLESAIKTYQQNFHIKPSGTLDAETISTMVTPRCGVPDIVNGTNYMQRPKTRPSGSTAFHIVSHYSFFSGSPKWSKTRLTYRFMPGFPTGAMAPVRNAFQKWASATQYFSFQQVQTSQADITIGFYSGSHGDNSPFDGRGGTLAHAYAPTDGRFHYDADELWSVGPRQSYFDLETVAVHEIGHLLGLGHSQVAEAIMYPRIADGVTKNIQSDDIQGIRALYGY